MSTEEKEIPPEGFVKKKKDKKDKRRHKKERKEEVNGDNGTKSSTSDSKKRKMKEELAEAVEKYPYKVDDDDHCESPPEAYAHIAPLLENARNALGKEKHELRIYDPYYCTGRMKENLAILGYTNVYNEKVDFYAAQAAGQLPSFDVLVTNPPYSMDHMERLVKFSMSLSVPWFLLMPNFVLTKDYWMAAMHAAHRPSGRQALVYVSPLKRYLYSTPYGRRQQKSAKYTSPFPTIWFCGLPKKGGATATHSRVADGAVLSTSVDTVPLDVLPENHPRKRKARNALKRKKNKAKKKGRTGS